MIGSAPPAARRAYRLPTAMALSLLLAHQPLRAATAQDQEVWPAGSAMAVGREHVRNRDRFAALLETRHAALLASLAAGDEGGGVRGAAHRKALSACGCGRDLRAWHRARLAPAGRRRLPAADVAA